MSAEDIWKNVLTAQQMAALGIDSTDTPHPKRHRPGKNVPRKGNGSQDQLLQLVARLALRTEDTVNQVLQEHQFVMHLQPGPESIIPIMLAASKKWHQEEKTTSLRHVLSSLMIKTVLAKVETLSKSNPQEPLWQACQSRGLIDGQGNMPFLRWNEKAKKLEQSKDATLSIQEVVRSYQNLLRLAEDPTTTLRFHSLVKTTDSTDKAIPWLWLLSNRHNLEAWFEIRRLCYHASWLLIEVQIRPQTTERTQLSKAVQKALNTDR
jgi:hypothetical protein